jgi:hypothetical protein
VGKPRGKGTFFGGLILVPDQYGERAKVLAAEIPATPEKILQAIQGENLV